MMPFARPTTTATPDEIFEEWVHVLTHAELLVLLYIVRRTLGFKKDRDAISYTQFLHGITTRDGRVLDRGCGLKSRSTLATALRQLEERSLIRSVKTQTVAGDQATTCYALWFVGDDDGSAAPSERGSTRGVPGWCVDRTTGSTPYVPPVVRGSYPQQTVETTNTKQHTVSSKREAPASSSPPPLDSSDSTGSTEGSTIAATTEASSPLLAAAVSRLSAEFGDDAPRASQTRVENLRRAAGLDETDLLLLLDEAAAIARSQAGGITKRGREGTIVRMPYLLATLRDLIAAVGKGTAASHTPREPTAACPTVACLTGSPPGSAADDPLVDGGAAAAVWRTVLAELREVLTPENYAAWFAPTQALSLEDAVLEVAVPSPFHADWLTHRLDGRVRQALERTGHAGLHLAYSVLTPSVGPPDDGAARGTCAGRTRSGD